MASWQTARFDVAYEEPLDPEIIPLCDALNAAGFVTLASCCGHGTDWPRVWFEHSSDERIEAMARYVLRLTEGNYRPFFVSFQKEVLREGYNWLIEVHLNDCYRDTPAALTLARAVSALTHVTTTIEMWAASECST